MKENRIHMNVRDRAVLRQQFGIDKSFLSRALTFQSNSMMARQIRSAAANYYNCKIEMNKRNIW